MFRQECRPFMQCVNYLRQISTKQSKINIKQLTGHPKDGLGLRSILSKNVENNTLNTKRSVHTTSETLHMMDLLRLHWPQIPFESITFKCHPFFSRKSKHSLAVEIGGRVRKNSIFMSICVFKSHQVSLTSNQDVFEGTYGGWWWVVVCGVVVCAWIVKREGKTVLSCLSCFENFETTPTKNKNPPKSPVWDFNILG